MKFRTLLLAGLLITSSSIAVFSQQKNITQEQLLKGYPKGIINSIPYPQGWENNNVYYLLDYSNGKFYSIDLKTGAKNEVEESKIFKSNLPDTQFKQQNLTNPTVSPDGKKLAYTKNNDLYVRDIESGKETRLTSDGITIIMNGYASWVYYEEILGRNSNYKAFWWSPDSKTLAYYKFDDSKVPMFPIYDSRGQHGYITQTRYPKAGDPNPEVKIAFTNIENGNTIFADFNEKEDQYFGIPFWNADGSRFIIPWMPREQDNLKLFAVNPLNGEKSFIYNENQKTWIDWPEDMQFTPEGFFMVRDFDLWEQIYFLSFDGKRLEKLTDGNNWGIKFIKVDLKNNEIYYSARKESSDRYDLYKVDIKSKKVRRLTTGNYNYSNFEISPDNKHFLAKRSNSNTPDQLVMFTVDKNRVEEKILVNSKGENFNEYKIAIPQMKYIMVDGYRLPAQIVYPVDMDSTKKYPVIINMYGGPNSGTVMDTWQRLSRNQWWANEGVIQINIDHRASGHAGKKGLNEIHRNLLKTELKDYIEWVKWLRSKPYVDADKIGITGFSYGGSMTMIAVTEGSEYFKYGIAGGGVYDYSLYDTHYTERYMDTPQSNPEGYAYTNTASKVKNYKGDSTNYVRITHGTSDDNVHMQNTMQLINALQDEGKQFDLMLYPGEFHGYRGAKRAHSDLADYIFWYKHLLDKDAPSVLINSFTNN